MQYTESEVTEFITDNDVKFIKMAFCDIFGRQKIIAIQPSLLASAFEGGIPIDASRIMGFEKEADSELFLVPDTSTMSLLPWRPAHGRVVRFFCDIRRSDGTGFDIDCRGILKKAVDIAKLHGIIFEFGARNEFYLFKNDENGNATAIPFDNAGFMDAAPEDKGEDVRREICLTLEQMGIQPERSHHEEGPGQNEIDFRYADPVTAADNAVTFRTVVHTIAARNGLCADFSPKPLAHAPGNGMHVNFSVHAVDGRDVMPEVIAGILAHITEMTAFLNATEESYHRFGVGKAPGYISWSRENRSQLIRIPAADGEYRRAELRSPDPMCNPYLAFTLLIRAGLDGIRTHAQLPEATDLDLYHAPEDVHARCRALPRSLAQAREAAAQSRFIEKSLPREMIEGYTGSAG